MFLAFFSPKAIAKLLPPREDLGQISYRRPATLKDVTETESTFGNPRYIIEVSAAFIHQAEDLKLPYLIVRGHREKVSGEKREHSLTGHLGKVRVLDLTKTISHADLNELDREYGILCAHRLWAERTIGRT